MSTISQLESKVNALTILVNSIINGAILYTKNETALSIDNPNEFVASIANPITSNTINLTATIGGGVGVIYYSGNILTKDSFSPVPVSFVNVDQVAGELCFVWITYDKGNNAFFVNVQNTWTGAIPEPPVVDTPLAPSLTLTKETIPSGGTAPLAPSLVLTKETIAEAVPLAPSLVLTQERIPEPVPLAPSLVLTQETI